VCKWYVKFCCGSYAISCQDERLHVAELSPDFLSRPTRAICKRPASLARSGRCLAQADAATSGGTDEPGIRRS
jgi:hypothetical protein